MQVKRAERGFSMLELAIVIALVLIVATAAMISMISMVRNQKADRAVQEVLSNVRLARQLAIDKRQVFVITFDTTNNNWVLTTTAVGAAGNKCTSATTAWPYGSNGNAIPLLGSYTFSIATGAPVTANAPDGLNVPDTSTPVYFSNTDASGTATHNTVCFYPDGTSRDPKGVVSSGVIFMSLPRSESATNRLNTMRAVTVFGATGRISGWRLAQASGGPVWKNQW